jgi:diguanylate cyclase
MLKFWYKEFPQYPQEHPDYWRTRLIQHALLIGTVFFLVLTLINLFYFGAYQLVLLDSSGFVITLAIYAWFRRSANVNLAAWAFAVMATGLVSLFVVMVGGSAHSLMWATLIPPFTFFLVGRQWGTLLSALVFSLCIAVVYQQVQTQLEVTFGTGALLNVIEVAIAHLLIFRFYERSRSVAYQQLAGKTEQMRQMAETDKLTGLYNRDKLDATLTGLLPDITQSNEPVTLMLLDIDHFKQINDEFGHLTGDKVLTRLAELLRSQMRNQDFIARWGGEEFVVLLPDTLLEQGAELAERLRVYIAAQSIEGHNLTISIGVAQHQQNESTEALLDRADKALYQAKHQGRNRVITA